MPKYFFHFRDHGNLIEDPEGLELAHVLPTFEECRRIVQAALDEEQWQDEASVGRQFEIVDELGQVVVTVPLGTVGAD